MKKKTNVTTTSWQGQRLEVTDKEKMQKRMSPPLIRVALTQMANDGIIRRVL